MPQIRLLSIEQVCKAVRLSAPYVRALADAGTIDSFIISSGWRAFPREVIGQIQQHEARKAADALE